MKSAKKNSSRFFLRSSITSSLEEIFHWYIQSKRIMPPWEKGEIVISEQAAPSQVVFIIKLNPFLSTKQICRFRLLNDKECEIEEVIYFTAPILWKKKREKRLKKMVHWRHERLRNDLQVKHRYPSSSLRILVSGSTGFVGSELCSFLEYAGHQVVPLSRKKTKNGISWNPETGEFVKEHFENFDAVVHLAGKNIASGFWTKKVKKEIFLSRCRDTWLLSQILSRVSHPPKVIICSSAIGIYGDRKEEELTEESAPGTGFLADLCQKWEEATKSIEDRGVRGVHTRFGLILSAKGGMLAKMIPLFRFGLGAILGSGKQWVSWIALDDVIYGIYHALMTKELEGPVNFTAPEPVTQTSFSKQLAKTMHRPLFFYISEKILHFLLGEMANEMLLSSVKAYPKKLQASGYSFFYNQLCSAFFEK